MKISSIAARRRTGSFSPNTSVRLRFNNVDMLFGTVCFLLTSSREAAGALSATLPTESASAEPLRKMRRVMDITSFLQSTPIWPRVASCPVWEFRELAAELAFQACDVGAVADTLEPFDHRPHFLAA